MKSKVELLNNLEESKGSKDYDCPLCGNKVNVFYLNKDFEAVVRKCECVAIRRSLAEIRRMGLQEAVNSCRFDNFKAEKPWQKTVLSAATEYVNSQAPGWFFIGGQSGSGKTHICTAIFKSLITEKKLNARYLTWKDKGTALKANVNSPEHEEMIKPYKECKVLYIDDFWKTSATGDINLAFELLDYRYKNKLPTIISSELTTDNLQLCDEAVGGRIIEMSKGFCLNIEKNEEKNYRLK